MMRRLKAVLDFYLTGFKEMTWGRQIWGLIILKLVILFLILRVFFFKPVLGGMSESEKSDFVGDRLTELPIDN